MSLLDMYSGRAAARQPAARTPFCQPESARSPHLSARTEKTAKIFDLLSFFVFF